MNTDTRKVSFIEFQRLSMKTDVVTHEKLFGKHVYCCSVNHGEWYAVASSDEEVYFPNVWEIPVPEQYQD